MLRPSDAVSLVKFDNRVQRLWPAAPLGDGAPQRAAIAGIHAGGNTDLHGGWKEGTDTLTDVAGQGLRRVILLSDGQANEGVADAAEIAAQCAAWAAKGITTSTYGLGHSFNEELMVAMAPDRPRRPEPAQPAPETAASFGRPPGSRTPGLPTTSTGPDCRACARLRP